MHAGPGCIINTIEYMSFILLHIFPKPISRGHPCVHHRAEALPLPATPEVGRRASNQLSGNCLQCGHQHVSVTRSWLVGKIVGKFWEGFLWFFKGKKNRVLYIESPTTIGS